MRKVQCLQVKLVHDMGVMSPPKLVYFLVQLMY